MIPKRNKRNFYFLIGEVIVHGQSERLLAEFVKSNLHLPFKITAKNKGKESIQINRLKAMLDKPPYNNQYSYFEGFGMDFKEDIEGIRGFKLFTIMDTDDCDDCQREDYISGSMFITHPLSKYIVPIYNTPDLEHVLTEAKLLPNLLKDDEKTKTYAKLFPQNTKPYSLETLNNIRNLSNHLTMSKKTNLDKFVNFCLSEVEKKR